jgi:hypothetical protein
MTHKDVTFDSDKLMDVLGVPGRLTHRTRKPGTEKDVWYNQRWISEGRSIEAEYGAGAIIRVEMRFDDECGNGHNTFAITATVVTPASRAKRDIAAGGCLHDDIAKVFPELAPLIKWHLMSTDGPMHYIANTLYHAGDRDHHGLRKGEVRQIRNGRTGLPAWKLTAINSKGEKVDNPLSNWGGGIGQVDAAEKPADPDIRLVYLPWNIIGEGKERNLEHARSSAVWPDAMDDILCLEPDILQGFLEARLPALIAEFRQVMEEIGFFWGPSTYRE